MHTNTFTCAQASLPCALMYGHARTHKYMNAYTNTLACMQASLPHAQTWIARTHSQTHKHICMHIGISSMCIETPIHGYGHKKTHADKHNHKPTHKHICMHVGIPLHTASTAFWHLPPNSAKFSYATEGALFISAQLSTDTVSALRKVQVLIWLWNQPSTQART